MFFKYSKTMLVWIWILYKVNLVVAVGRVIGSVVDGKSEKDLQQRALSELFSASSYSSRRLNFPQSSGIFLNADLEMASKSEASFDLQHWGFSSNSAVLSILAVIMCKDVSVITDFMCQTHPFLLGDLLWLWKASLHFTSPYFTEKTSEMKLAEKRRPL